MSRTTKQIGALIILVSFLALAIFGFSIITHGPNGNMSGDCPFSIATGFSLCFQNNVDVIIHHISTYQSFFQTSPNINLLIFAVFILFATIAFPNLLQFAVVTKRIPCVHPSVRKQTRWLSLLENSPS